MLIMRKIFRGIVSNIPLKWADRIYRWSVNKNIFKELENVKTFDERELLWTYLLSEVLNEHDEITFIEFGVWEGYSLKYFSEQNKNPNSMFIGLDTFEGLDEVWVDFSMDQFDVDGKLPNITDRRVQFFKGYFQDTFGQLEQAVQGRSNFIVHFDADLYSSTLFALTKIDELTGQYYAIFDEFNAGENTALYNYMQAYLAKNNFLAKTSNKTTRVLSLINTHKS